MPEYEVRLLLDPAAVLSPQHELMDTVLLAFEMPPTVTKLNVQFLDTSPKELFTADWSARIRKTENQDGFELTYKKRYAITGSDIDVALTAANSDGFKDGNSKYEAQVEWGYQKQTLSISRKKTVKDHGNSGMNLPGTSNSRKMLISEAPDKFDNWRHNKRGTGALAISRIFGPVLTRRSIGTWNKMKLYIEVWPLVNLSGTENEYVVEASFKTESFTEALIEQSNLATFLQSKGWFLPQDSLKTQLIMERY
ncbi:hypothetical protein N7532_001730 [Penicillium argentinense]|uniref:CYTH domain-containing protein n=1 Tax=Penicillium argentinense TaxID=1131581 RepID=A0A9W9KM25_9EURO|nr:uncharacterized protein N7532_001730 [Penicillium argentinense]KAJ5111195.1 hypothetical protein N7532_001730 [Penicillium argentinense]